MALFDTNRDTIIDCKSTINLHLPDSYRYSLLMRYSTLEFQGKHSTSSEHSSLLWKFSIGHKAAKWLVRTVGSEP